MRRAGSRAGAILSVVALAWASTTAAGAVGSPAGSTTRGGIASETARQILAGVQRAEARTSGVHLVGRITQPSTTVSFSLDLTGGGDGEGTFHQSGQTMEVEKLGGDVYVKASAAFWRANGAGAKAARINGRWIEAPADNADFTSLAQFLGLDRLTTQLLPAGSVPRRKRGTAEVDGRRAVLVVGRTTAGGRTETTTLYVAASGAPYVLEARAVSGGEVGVLTFTHYGEKVRVRAPAHPLDVTGLGLGRGRHTGTGGTSTGAGPGG